MKRLLLFASAIIMICSCGNNHKAQISAVIKGADTASIILQKLNYNKLQTVDTIRTDAAGKFKYNVELTSDSPVLYYLYSTENQKLASMILLPGDKVAIDADLTGNYTVTGSEESAKLKEYETEFAKAKSQMAILAGKVDANTTDAEIREINAQLSKIYINYKQSLIKKMMNDPKSLTAAIAAFYKFNENLPVFDENTDAIIFRSIYNELSQVYPKSEYLQALMDEIQKRERNMELNYKLEEFSEVGFPDLNMPDVNGQMKSLKDLNGNVVFLMFWSASMDEQRLFNHDLIDLYNKYHSKGFEIYQVALDIDKAVWASVVKAQGLPWISVNDGYGVDSPSLMAYNIQSIPAMFLISKDGDLVVNDITSVASLENALKKLL